MRVRAVRLGLEARQMLEALASMEGLSLSDAVRKSAILGLGGNADDVDQANRLLAERREVFSQAAAPSPMPRKPVQHGAYVDDSANVLSCRMPSPWNQRVSARGAFAAAVRAGLSVWMRGGG
jgi:hypothetical protein